MNVFASDLDRTLIYSKRMLTKYPKAINYKPVEYVNNKALSFMSEKVEEHLKAINRSMYFIPVTTRTFEQYLRLTIFQETIIPEYAIINNGATILEKGQPMQDWLEHIQSRLQSCTTYQDMLNQVSRSPVFKKVDRVVETAQTFIFLKMKQDVHDQNDLLELKQLLQQSGWRLTYQDKKIYIIPQCIDKWLAVDFLSRKLKLKQIYSAGDSWLDHDLLLNASFAVSPRHGDVDIKSPHVIKTRHFGIKASEEITDAVLNTSQLIHRRDEKEKIR